MILEIRQRHSRIAVGKLIVDLHSVCVLLLLLHLLLHGLEIGSME